MDYVQAANKLHHLSMIYVGGFCEMAQGKELGAIPNTFPGLKKTRDFLDIVLFVRAEMNALSALLVKKGVFTAQEWEKQCIEEYEYMTEKKGKQFGVKVTDYGLQFTVGGDG